jgi:hypothetical protein
MRALFRFADVVVSDHVVVDRDDRRLRYGVRDDSRAVIVEYLSEQPKMMVYAWQSIVLDAICRGATATLYDVDTAPVLVYEPAPALIAATILEQQSRERGRVPREIVAAFGLCGVQALQMFNAVSDDPFALMQPAQLRQMIWLDLDGRLHARPQTEHQEHALAHAIMTVPPERLTGQGDPRAPSTDAYRIGLFLHSLCFGRLPYENLQDLAVGRRAVATPTDALEELAFACTQPIPASRPSLAHIEGVLHQHHAAVDLAGFARGLLPDVWRALELTREELALLARDAPRLLATPFDLSRARQALQHPPPAGLGMPFDLQPKGDVRDLPG